MHDFMESGINKILEVLTEVPFMDRDAAPLLYIFSKEQGYIHGINLN